MALKPWPNGCDPCDLCQTDSRSKCFSLPSWNNPLGSFCLRHNDSKLAWVDMNIWTANSKNQTTFSPIVRCGVFSGGKLKQWGALSHPTSCECSASACRRIKVSEFRISPVLMLCYRCSAQCFKSHVDLATQINLGIISDRKWDHGADDCQPLSPSNGTLLHFLSALSTPPKLTYRYHCVKF